MNLTVEENVRVIRAFLAERLRFTDTVEDDNEVHKARKALDQLVSPVITELQALGKWVRDGSGYNSEDARDEIARAIENRVRQLGGAELDELRAANLIFRRLLWSAHSNGQGYGDDGELQAGVLDFKRMSAQELEAGIIRRGQQKVAEYLQTPEGKALREKLGSQLKQ